MIVYEHRLHQRRHGKVVLMTREEALSKGGFISVAGYPEDTASIIRAQGGTYGLSAMPLYVDQVVLDFDNAQGHYETSLLKCERKGWDFKAYVTGNRGHHIHINVLPLCEAGAHLKMERWVAENFNGYDPSLYKSSSITRIPGTYHSKTGKRMELEYGKPGTNPDLNDVTLRLPQSLSLSEPAVEEDYELILAYMMEKQVYSGERHGYAFKLASLAYRTGKDYDKVCEIVHLWNTEKCDPPITERAAEHAIKCAERSGR